MLLTSPNISITPVEEYSNGNCEILIAELPTINTTVISIYRDHQGKIGRNVLLTADFNFTPNVVVWETSDNGLVPNYKAGEADEKRAFQLLLDLVEDLELEQVVDKPTRNKNILDLIFTRKPCLMSECETSILKPVSDQNLIHTTISSKNLVESNTNNGGNRFIKSEIAMFDFKGANQDAIRQNIKDLDWDQLINNNTDPETLNQKILRCTCQNSKYM